MSANIPIRIRPLLSLAVLGLILFLGACSPIPTGDSIPGPHTASAKDAKPAKKTETGPFTRRLRPDSRDDGAAAPPLLPGLGTLSYPATAANPRAQEYFDQGLRLTYAFNHGEALRAFREAQRLDPACAMCFWGEALVLGPNINAPMAADARPRALAALERAKAAAPAATPKERDLIGALEQRYDYDPAIPRPRLDAAYAEAMGDVAERYPLDDQIAVLYAESLMDLSPWDYWEAGGTRPKGRTAELIQLLESILRRNPEHPGAIHYYIHTVEASDRPQRAEAYAERLGALMPGAGHLVHMPAHIYYRLGRYRDSIEANRRAVAADEAYFARIGQRPAFYGDVYYPHNVHFLLTSAQMAGDGKTALEAADKLAGLVGDDTARSVPLIQPIRAAPLFAHAQFSPPERLMKLPPPAEGLPYIQAVWHYVRGLGFAGLGDLSGAQGEWRQLETLRREGNFQSLTGAGVPATEVVAIAADVLHGRIAAARKQWRAAAQSYQSAADRQEKLPYMEPPFWYYPVRQSLGIARLHLGQYADAERCFNRVLKDSPNNGWALFGLREVYQQRGDRRQLREVEQGIGRVWLGEAAGPALERI